MKRSSMVTVFAVFLAQAGVAAPAHRTLSLAEALRLGERVSPDLKAGAARESQSQAALRIARSYLYPSVDVSAVDSTGFTGSTSPVPPELAGIITSPYRVGPAVGVLGRLTVFDLSDWYGIAAAREQKSATGEQTKVVRLRVDQLVLQTYLESARIRGEMEVWDSIAGQVEALEKTVHRLVKNGQASEVEGLLIDDQGDESRTNQLSLQERYRRSLRVLSLLIGGPEGGIDCPVASSLTERDLEFLKSRDRSPLLTQSEAELRSAKAVASKASAQNYPKLYAGGSAGLLSDAIFVNKKNYAAWVGITVPLFEGFRISSESERAEALVDEKEDTILSAKLQVDTESAHYDELIASSRLELKLLIKRQEAAKRAFALAKRRYLSFLEPVINLRQSIQNLARIQTRINRVNADLLSALGSRALLNGAVVEP